MIKRFFFVVDKNYGTSHSFVDGLIKKYILPLNKKNRIYYAKRNKGKIINHDASDSAIIESNYSRNGIERIFFSVSSIFYFIKNFNKNDNNEVFIRNEVLALFFFSSIKFFCPNLYSLSFQNSFPHETFKGRKIKSIFAKLLINISLKKVDKIYVVSNLAADRIKRYPLNANTQIFIIPLCTDFPLIKEKSYSNKNLIKFVYIGTFYKLRRLDLLIQAFYSLKQQTGYRKWRLDFFGGDLSDFIDNYPETSGIINELILLNLVKFHGFVKREDLHSTIDDFDVGINLIPPTKMYLESSSTKLGEYLARGLPVLSNLEIPFHKYVYSKGDIGWLCNFSIESIQTEILKILKTDDNQYSLKSETGLKIVREHLNYKNHLHSFFD